MGLCDPKTLSEKEESSQKMFLEFAQADGEILTRKVNDKPEPGKGFEWGWLHSIKDPVDFYFASWKKTGPSEDTKAEAIRYFMFIDGGFRWYSNILLANQIKFQNKVKVYTGASPKLIKGPQPAYPPAAVARHITGTVRVAFFVGADGVVYDPHAISGNGFSDDPILRKAAEEAVLQWRYEPAMIEGKPVRLKWSADITFYPAN